MNIPDPSTLRKAIAITTEIERLEKTLHELLKNALSKSEASLSSDTKKPSVKISKGVKRRGRPAAATEAMKVVPDAVTSEMSHHDSLLLVDDSGEEQLVLVSDQESCALHQHAHAEESGSLTHDAADHQADEGAVFFMESPQ